MSEESMCYIGRKTCGCLVAAMVDSPDHKQDTAREVAKWVREGLALERVTCAYVRSAVWGCTHEPLKRRAKGDKQLALEAGHGQLA